MNPLVLGPIMEIGRELLNRFGPEDKEAKAKAENEFLMMAATGELQTVIKQLEINAIEAAHPSIWTSGWRPYFGWVGGTSFMYVGLLKPLLTWIALIKGWPEPPEVDTEFLWVVISGMLGIGGLRTFEKAKKVTK